VSKIAKTNEFFFDFGHLFFKSNLRSWTSGKNMLKTSCNGHNLCPKVINLNPTRHHWTFFCSKRRIHSSNNSILCKFDYAIFVCPFYFQFEEPFTLHLYFGCSYLSNIVQRAERHFALCYLFNVVCMQTILYIVYIPFLRHEFQSRI